MVLTVLGVIIGTSSIFTMMSLDLSISRQTKQFYEPADSVETITAYSLNQKGSETGIIDGTIKQLKRLTYVDDMSPQPDASVVAKCGLYEGCLSLIDVFQHFLKEPPLRSGALPLVNMDALNLLYGDYFRGDFYKVSKNSSANFNGGNGGSVHIDPLKDIILYIFSEGYKPTPKNNSNDSGISGGGAFAVAMPVSVATETSDKPQKKYILGTVGVLDDGGSDYNNYNYSTYCDIDALKNFLRQRYRKYLVLEPKLNKKGKPAGCCVYSQAYVFVDGINHASEVQKKIAELGYQTDSNMEWLEQSRQSTGMVQTVLGGTGAVPLSVAAIGIVNTMVIFIYERTREISVMRVLGCEVTNIRDLFPVESGFIGLMGGIIGTILSLLASLLINFLAAQGDSEQLSVFYQNIEDRPISYTPPWPTPFAIVSAIFISAAAGYLPAKRIMHLSPLAAMRNE